MKIGRLFIGKKVCNDLWLDNAHRICDGWNSHVLIAKLQAELKHNQQALNNRAMKFVMIENELAKLQKDNAKLIELLADARDDIADKVYLNSQMLPYKKNRYDASVKQLADIDALLAEIENESI